MVSPCSKQNPYRHHSPVSSASDPVNRDDFVVLDDDSFEAKWDGDQTKYIAPTLKQSITASAKLALDGVRNEPLTGQSVIKAATPLAKDLGLVAKEGVGIAVGLAGQAFKKVSIAAAAAVTAASDPVRLSSPTEGLSDCEPAPHALSPYKPKEPQPRLPDNEEVATKDKQSPEVKDFLANLRKGQALVNWKGKTIQKHEVGYEQELQWTIEADEGFDPLGVSSAYKHLGVDVHDANATKALREEWATRQDANANNEDDEVEEIPLAKPFVEDSDVIEDAVSSGESAHGVWSERIG
ncbi:MAG: hypothetical protein L6R39_001286 [Caloplaca ligustica]|nr:MAG: hypothetical protein L6R39_001286 [Caloplaca ligustica]